MISRRTSSVPGLVFALFLAGAGCGTSEEDPPPSGSGGRGGSGAGTGGSTSSSSGGSPGSSSGGSPGSGGSGAGGVTGGGGSGAGGSSAGGSGAGGRAGSGGSGAGGRAGSGGASPGDAGSGDGSATVPPSAPGQGPVALGRIVFSQDFEKDRVGINKGMRAVPEERIQVVDDPLNKRGKVLNVIFQQGDNFRTSPGTEPRTWVSNRPNGYEFPPGTKVSHAFGVMFGQNTMNYCFGQVISTGGPVWMLIGDGSNTLTIFCNACGDANTRHFRLEPNVWHDFRVDMDFRNGGAVQFFHNGQMIRQSTLSGTRGTLAHWDGGIYNRPAGTGGPTRNVWISNLSVGER